MVPLMNVCQAQIDSVNAAQNALQALQTRIQKLQLELQTATPQEKSGIIEEIKQMSAHEIPPAQATLDNAKAALEKCKAAHNHMPDRPVLSHNLE